MKSHLGVKNGRACKTEWQAVIVGPSALLRRCIYINVLAANSAIEFGEAVCWQAPVPRLATLAGCGMSARAFIT